MEITGLEEVFKEYSLSKEEIKIFNLMKQYEAVCRGKGKFITMFKKNCDPREAKYWGAFVKFWDNYKNRRIDPALFFAAQLETWDNAKNTPFIPNFLSAESSWKRYKKYINVYKVKLEVDYSSKKEVAKAIFKSHTFIKKWLTENGMNENNYKAFFSYKENFDDFVPDCYKFIVNGVVNRMYLAISSSFGEVQEEWERDIKDELMTLDELDRSRKYMLTNEKVREYSMHLLKDEFNMSWKY